MILMPADVYDPAVRALNEEYPGLLGNLVGPGYLSGPLAEYYVLDNGRFNAEKWTPEAFLRHCDLAAARPIQPQWVAIPDVYGDFNATLWGWEYWAHRIRATYGWPLAFVWQDGITPELVKAHTDAEVQFIGGTNNVHIGKWTMVPTAAAHFPRVHVGRVNAPRPALKCLRLGVESIDGTGWRMTDRQRDGMLLLLEMMKRGEKHLESPLFEDDAA